MKIKTLKLTNFRSFEAADFTFDARLTLLIARNGSGKSSILDAIAIAYGSFLTRLPGVSGLNFKATDFRVAPDGKKPAYMRVKCQSFSGITWDRSERRDPTKKTATAIPEAMGVKQLHQAVDQLIDADNTGQPYMLPVFIYYGTGRGVFEIPQRKRGFSKTFSRFASLQGALESKTNFKRFVEYFYYLEDQESRLQKAQRSFDAELPELKAIRAAIQRLMPQFSNPRITHPAGIMLDWHDNGVQRKLKIEQLSDGYRTTLAMVMDIAARMAEANPDMSDPLSTTGTILIDEVDLHLHPDWQREFLPKLLKVFPEAQFIASTHSPFIVQSIKQGQLIDLDQEDVDNSPALNTERSIEDIAEQLMGVSDVQRSQGFIEQTKIADTYYQLLDSGLTIDNPQIQALERKLDELEEKFGDNPAYIALLRSERRKRLSAMLGESR